MKLDRKLLGRIFWSLLLLALLTPALAQDGGGFHFDPEGWGSNPTLAALALAGAVAWVRHTAWGRAVDGPVRVFALAAVLGGGGGAYLQARAYLIVDPYAGFPFPWGGISYGLAVALAAVFGVSLFNYGAQKIAHAIAPPSPSLGFLPSSSNPAVQFVLDYLRGLLGEAKLPEGVKAVAPLLAELLQSQLVLTEDVRADLQGRALTLLRKAGLVGVDL